MAYNNILLQPFIALFADQPSWQDRYRQIIQLTKTLPAFNTEWKIAENQIQGCENKAWLYYHYNQQSNTLHFYVDSEGRIVKGLLAILVTLVNNQPARYILTLDLPMILKEMKIIGELSETRQLGLTNAIERIRQIALQYCNTN